MYRTHKIRIKKGHRLHKYFDGLCADAKNLYNATNFHFRQVLTGTRKDPTTITPLEKEAIDTINDALPAINRRKQEYVAKRRVTESSKPPEEQKVIRDAKKYQPIGKDNPYTSYELLDAVFKVTKNPDYLALPAQSNQWVMKQVFSDWKSFFNSLADYKANPEKYKGRPRIPRYAKKNGRKTVLFTNQACLIKDNKYLKFPKTKERLNIGKLGLTEGAFQQVRIIPSRDYVELELVFRVAKEEPTPKRDTPERILGIDLGVDNFAAVSNNIGQPPLLVKGTVIKSQNYFYNRQRAHYYGVLRQGHAPNKGLHVSHQLDRLDKKRHAKIKDYFHKVSRRIVQYAEERDIDTIVVGKNKHWKQEIKMRRSTKLTFSNIPYNLFLDLLTYKAAEKGIVVIQQEESYTSKASFLDGDPIPVYGEVGKPTFSGRRISRGRYKTSSGLIINADVNASYNILKKAFSNAFDKRPWDKGDVTFPLVLSVA